MANRDANGRFLPGHTPSNNGKGGRKSRKKEEQYLARMVKVVTLKDWEEITLTAIARAKAGDSTARKWLSDYLLGPPPQRLEHSGPEGEPIKLDNAIIVRDYLNGGND